MCIPAEEIEFEIGHFRTILASVTLTLTLGRSHVAYRRVAHIDFNQHTKFRWNWRSFLWTEGQTDEQTLRPALCNINVM